MTFPSDTIPVAGSTNQRIAPSRALVMGFFSTVGDIACLRNVQQWLSEARLPYDVAPYSEKVRTALSGSVNPRTIDPTAYSHLIVVCGPCWPQFFRREKINLDRFEQCIRIGVNLTMIEPLESWNPFDIIQERDSRAFSRPDLAFLGSPTLVPVVGRCLIDSQKEYGNRQRHSLAIRVVNELIVRRDFAVIDIDTRWQHPARSGAMKTPASVLSVLKRVDLLLTNRLHGLVFAIKASVPVIVIDPIAGGGKVAAQARVIGWPKCVLAEQVTADWMEEAVDWCGSAEAKAAIHASQQVVQAPLRSLAKEFRCALKTSKPRRDASRTQRKRFLFWMKQSLRSDTMAPQASELNTMQNPDPRAA